MKREKILKRWKKVLAADLKSVACELKACLLPPAVIILKGEVGAGKTTLVQNFIQVLYPKMPGLAISPSYSLIHEMGGVVHADFYRLEEGEDIVHLELPLYLEKKDYCFVEWGEKFLSTLQRECGDDFSYYKLHIEETEDAFRHLALSKLTR